MPVDLLKILRSFEEFLFEAMSWLYFYPRTLARIVMRPLAMMAYSDAEVGQDEATRYDDALSPPMLLLITLGVASVIGWAMHAPMPQAARGLVHEISSSQEYLLLFRCLVFSLLPLIAALTLLRKLGAEVTRETLRRPFYAQCYLAAPSALALSLGAVGVQHGDWQADIGWAVIAGAGVWLVTVQTLWFRGKLNVGLARAAATAGFATLRAALYLLLILLIVALF